MFHISNSVHSLRSRLPWLYCFAENALNMLLASYSGLGNLAVDSQMGS